MQTATDTQITNATLIAQLEALNAATLYEGVNNITTTAESGNLPAILDLTYQTWFKGEKGDTGPANSLSIGTVESGSTAAATITGTPPNQTLNLTLPKGDPGQNGTDGADGYSPTATVTKSGDTATITITDKNGTTTATVKDGTTGTTDYEDLTDVYYTDITLQAVWDSVNGYYVITTISPIRTTAPVVGDKIRVQFDTAHTGSAVQIKVNSDSVLGCVVGSTSVTNVSTNRVYEFVKTQETGQSAVWNAISNLVDAIYPIGSIYMSVSSTNPGNLFGGTWSQIKDTFLLSAGDTYTAGSTGGEATHTLTVNEMPSHKHAIPYVFGSIGGGGSWITDAGATSNYNPNATGATGGGQAHNNMPPYLTVYMWQRTA